MAAAYKPGPRNLITDVAGLKVGNAQDAVLKSGSTVLTADKPFTASVHVMGGAPGTRETDLLAADRTVTQVDALVLSGGSGFGLDAGSGVADALRQQGRGYAIGDIHVPIVPGAIIFDLINGGDKSWTENPYRALGRTALENASADFAIGTAGAGTGALCAMQKGGLGSASMILPGGITVGALVVANPLGSVTTPGDRHFWAAPFEIDGEFGGIGPDTSQGLVAPQASRKEKAMMLHAEERANTTIAIVATNAPMTKTQCHRLAVTAHDGIARAVVPAHTPHDGDLVFGVAMGNGEGVDRFVMRDVGAAAAICLSRAICRGVYAATPAESDIIPTYAELI